MAQELSGNIWTDYNQHDPGVTILEQLCFGLTELGYRTTFKTTDYFTDSNGHCDFAKQGLYNPEDIFPCAPVTAVDHGKFLFAAIPILEDVAVRVSEQGLYNISVCPFVPMDSESSGIYDNEKISAMVQSVWHSTRSMGEDLESVQVLATEPCYLRAELEIQPHSNPAEIIAEAYFRCARVIASDIQIERYDRLLAEGGTLEHLFTGPLCPMGYCPDLGFKTVAQLPKNSDLTATIQKIPGVLQVRNLKIVNGAGMPPDHHSNPPRLVFPKTIQDPYVVQLFVGNAALPWSLSLLESARSYLQKFEFGYRAFRQETQLRSQLPALPQGEYRPLGQYYPIKEHFPQNYGVGHAGLASTASLAAREGASQLKAYLYPMEQTLANSYQTLAHIPELFAIRPQDEKTYFTANLQATPSTRPAAPLARVDDTISRRIRLLEQSLGIYGIAFPSSLFKQLHGDSPSSHNKRLECMRLYLAELPVLTYARTTPTHWLRRLQLLLGLHEQQVPELIEPILLRKRNDEVDPFLHAFAQTIVLAWNASAFIENQHSDIEEYVRSLVPAHLGVTCLWLANTEWSELQQRITPWKQEPRGLANPLRAWIEATLENHSQRTWY